MQVQMFDVGMNEGEVTAMMIATLRKLHVKDWVIHGFEPHPKWFAHCKHRFRKYPNVHVYPLAIGEKDGKAKLFQATKNTVGNSPYDDKFNVDPSRYDTVSVCRFSSWLDRQLWSRHAVNILKMNIEGAEWSVYRDLVESNWHMHFDFFLGTPGDEDNISKIAHLKSRRDAYDQFLHDNKILVKRYTDYIPDRNWDLQSNLENRLRQKKELRSKLLITAFCTENYSAYLPFLAYSAHHLPGSPAVRIYAPAEDVSACQRQLDEIVNRLGIDAEVLPYTRFTTARCYDDQTCKMLRWLMWDPQWADYDGVLMTDVDMVLTDKWLLESRLRHAQDIQKPYSNVVRPLRDSSGNLKMQGVHFFEPSTYGHLVKPIADRIANQMNTRTLKVMNNEAILARMMEEAFGLPSYSPHEVISHHHGVHVKAFNPVGYSFRTLDTFIAPEHLGAAFSKLARDSDFRRLKNQSPRKIRRQLNRAVRYSRYLQLCEPFKKLRRRIGSLYRRLQPDTLQWKSHLPSRVGELCGHRFKSELFGKCPTIVDVGFKFGEFSIPFVKRFGGRVIGVEPCDASITEAKRRLSKEDVGSEVRLLAAALWQDSNGVEFYEFPAQPQSNSVYARRVESGTATRVASVTMQDLLRRVDGIIDLLKVDCEGAEWQVFRAMDPEQLREVKQFSIELHTEFVVDWGVHELEQFFKTAGYQTHINLPWNDPTRPEIWGYRPCPQT
ncbi:MAG: FkbM family methyltransferase [Pirellulales bacterium]|nr:FkbM family methyltransferase [Pirellulales bacterium]